MYRGLIARIGIGSLALFVLICFFLRHSKAYDSYIVTLGYSLLAWAGAAVVLSAYLSRETSIAGRVLRSKVLAIFGTYSYGIYVYQTLIQEAVIRVFARQPWWGHSLKYAALLTVFWAVLPLLVAVASYHLWEARFLALKFLFAARRA